MDNELTVHDSGTPGVEQPQDQLEQQTGQADQTEAKAVDEFEEKQTLDQRVAALEHHVFNKLKATLAECGIHIKDSD